MRSFAARCCLLGLIAAPLCSPYIEHGDKRFGPYSPIGAPIPLHRYRAFKKTSTQQRADRVEALAEQLALPRAALEGNPHAALLIRNIEVPVIMFTDPDPFQEFAYPNVLAAKRAIADYLAIPLAKLSPEKLDWINTLVSNTLNKKDVIEQVLEVTYRERWPEQRREDRGPPSAITVRPVFLHAS